MLFRSDNDPKFGESSPGPAAYNIHPGKNAPSFSIGQSRQTYKTIDVKKPSPADYYPKVEYCRPSSPNWKICKSLRDTSIGKKGGPDPATYNLPGFIGKAPKAILAGKRSKDKVESFPGPGAYNPNMKVILENYPGIVVSTGPRTEKDLRTCKDDPGPGTYKVPTTLSGPRCKFGKQVRNTKSLTEFVLHFLSDLR